LGDDDIDVGLGGPAGLGDGPDGVQVDRAGAMDGFAQPGWVPPRTLK
jgi:hypothetical protein